MRHGIFTAGIPCVTGERLMRLNLRGTNCEFVSDPLSQTSLLPSQAVSLLNERIRQIGKINADVADWLLVCIPMLMTRSYLCSYTNRNVGRLRSSTSKA